MFDAQCQLSCMFLSYLPAIGDCIGAMGELQRYKLDGLPIIRALTLKDIQICIKSYLALPKSTRDLICIR